MPMSIPFARGQQFQSAVPDEDVLVQVINPGICSRPGEVYIGTVSNTSGKLIRQRWVNADRFHDSWLLKDGRRRQGGWVLVQSQAGRSAPVDREVVKKFCRDLGYDPGSVAEILIRPGSVTFELYKKLSELGADGSITVLVTHPLT